MLNTYNNCSFYQKNGAQIDTIKSVSIGESPFITQINNSSEIITMAPFHQWDVVNVIKRPNKVIPPQITVMAIFNQ